MGMTPLEGLMMGTRSGDVDFGAMSWVASQTNQSLGDLERVVNKESGLLGISGLSSDLRVLEKPGMKVTNARNWQLKPLFTELPVILPDTLLHYIAWMELYSPAE